MHSKIHLRKLWSLREVNYYLLSIARSANRDLSYCTFFGCTIGLDNANCVPLKAAATAH